MRLSGTSRALNGLGVLFFGTLAVVSLMNLIHTRSVLSLGLLAYNVLLALLLLVRRAPAQPATRAGQALGLAGMLLPFALMLEHASEEMHIAGLVIQVVALLWMIVCVLSLGTSFGIAPADRGLVMRGPYHIVRHPLYLGELVFFGGALIAQPSALRLVVWMVLMGVQVVRLLVEERAITWYDLYAQTVRWRLVPGLW